MVEELTKDDNVAWCPKCSKEMILEEDKLKPHKQQLTYFCKECNLRFKFKKLKEGPLERLAALQHDIWVEWSKELIKTEPTISLERTKRWTTLWVPYSELTEEQKEQDRVYSKRVMKLLRLK